MTPWDTETLKTLQEHEMTLLAELDAVCTRLNIPYFLAAGTLLGAMRHGAMIPWDDDIDVYLHREDYDRLLDVLQQELPPGRFVQTQDTDPAYPYPFAKIRMDHTAFVQEALKDLPMHHGIYIDLFPVDGAPRDLLRSQWQRMKLFFFKRVSIGHILPRRIERVVYAALYRIVPRERLQRAYDRYCRAYDSRKTGICLTGTSDYAYRRERMPRAVYGTGKRVPFGPLSLPVPDDADRYLTIMYGDWRTPPPPEQRASQHAPWHIDFLEEYHP